MKRARRRRRAPDFLIWVFRRPLYSTRRIRRAVRSAVFVALYSTRRIRRAVFDALFFATPFCRAPFSHARRYRL
jgi:hypothetical protein